MSLKRKAVRGAIWTVLASIGGRAVGLIGTLVLTHFLTPREYGAVSVGTVVVTTVNVLTMMGFGQYVVAHPKEGDRTVFHATFFHLLVGGTALTAVWLFSGWAARLFDAPELAQLLGGIVLAVGIERVAYMPGRVLARDMRFGILALRMLAGEVAYAGVALVLAMRGVGAASLVWAMLARSALIAGITLSSMSPRRWLAVGRLSAATTRGMLRFSLPMAAAGWLHWLSRRGDNLLIAGMFGPAVAGQYNLAYNLADIPASQIGEHIGDVLLPSFAKMKRASERKRALVRAGGLLALLVFPLAVGLALVAPTLVRAILDPRWWSIAPMLVVLSVLSVMRPVGWLVAAYLQAVHRTPKVLVLEVVNTVGIVVLVLLLGQVSVLWACAGIGIAYGVNAAGSLWVVHKDDGVSLLALTKPLIAPLVSCAPMAAAVLALRPVLAVQAAGPWLQLSLEITAGALVYAGSAWMLASRQSRDLLGLLRGALSTRPLAAKST